MATTPSPSPAQAPVLLALAPGGCMLALLLLMLSACGGGSGGNTVTPPPDNTATPQLAVAQPGELLTLARQRLADSGSPLESVRTPSGAPMLAMASDAVGSGGGAAVLRSTTLVQEAGVDEADLVKTQGGFVYTQDGSNALRVRSYALQADGSVQPHSSVSLSAPASASVLVHGLLPAPDAQRLAVVNEWMTYSSPPIFECPQMADCLQPALMPAVMPFVLVRNEVRVSLLRMPADGSLALDTELSITGRLVGVRRLGQQLVLVSTHSPSLPVTGATGSAERQAALARLSNADLLPRLRVGSQAEQPLLADTDCYLQTAASSAGSGLQITTITTLDLGSPTLARRSRCFVGEAEALYMSPQSLYLATSRAVMVTEGGVLRYTGTLRTDIHKFNLASLDWRGSGQVDGHLGWDPARKPYRLSEHQGLLRVLSFTGSTGWRVEGDSAQRAPSPATLSVLREAASGPALETVATLPNARRPEALGHAGEQVYGVRFIGERGYVVTFRRTDPLFVLDLADPADPKTVGELQVPGFSDHLFGLDNGLLLGAGRDADANGNVTGLRFSLFDVSNPAQPRALDSVTLGQNGSASALDHGPHGLALRVDGDQVRLAVPVVTVANNFSSFQPGVLRMTADTRARSLVAKPLLPSTAPGAMSLWDQRLVLSNDKLLHLVGGDLLTLDW